MFNVIFKKIHRKPTKKKKKPYYQDQNFPIPDHRKNVIILKNKIKKIQKKLYTAKSQKKKKILQSKQENIYSARLRCLTPHYIQPTQKK